MFTEASKSNCLERFSPAMDSGYATHEREVLERVTQLRNQCAANNGPVADQSRDEVQLVDALKQLLVVVENYPQLKADQNFLQLQKELVNTEDRIQAARRFYNGNVRDYRNKCETFPSNLVANLFGFKSEGRLGRMKGQSFCDRKPLSSKAEGKQNSTHRNSHLR